MYASSLKWKRLFLKGGIKMIRNIYILLIGLMVLSLGNSTVVAQKKASDLETMLAIINHHNDMSIKEWSVIARESVDGIKTEEQFLLEANRLQENLPDFKWQIINDKNAVTVIGKRQDSIFTETVTLASALTSATKSYMNYEIKGTEVSNEVLGQLKERKNAAEQLIFSRYAIFFTCVKGEISGNIDKVLTSKAEDLMFDFKAVETEGVKEEHFMSITANSSLFEQSFISEQYNLQLAMRFDGLSQKTTYVFGTPIITFEY